MKKILSVKLIMLVLGILMGTSLLAQESDFTADRPGAATGTDILSKGAFQWETGVGFDMDGALHSYTLNNTLFRFGISNAAEIRIGMDWLLDYDSELRQHQMGVSALNIGTKVRLYQGEGWIPTFSVLTNLAIPRLGSAIYCPEHLAPSLYLLIQHDWCDWLNVGYNVGAEWDGFSAKPDAFAAISFGFSPTDRLGCFVEGYGYFQKGKNDFWTDFGLSWMAADHVQLDLAANINLNNPLSVWGISGGIAWQILPIKRK